MRRELPKSPGVLSPEAYRDREKADVARRRRRARARAGGKASGIARRQRAKGRAVPQRRTRELALEDCRHVIRQVTYKEFERLYRSVGSANRQGVTTGYKIYRHALVVARLAYHREQPSRAQTTNARCTAALVARWRPRCTRTVQRHHRRLERMGLMRFSHIKRKGSKKGERDSLRIVPIKSNVTLPEGQQRQGLRPYLSLLERQKRPSVDAEDGGRDRRSGDTANSGHRERGEACPPVPRSGAGDELGSSVTPSELSPWAGQLMLRLGLSP